MIVLFFMLLIIVLVCVIKYAGYVNSTYYNFTKKPVLAMRTDVGSYGEYCIFKLLKSYESQGAKFLFNVYLPKGENETTEIDVLMICSQGIYVFESKNYSGWIFGNEKYKMWTQTLPQGKGRPSKKEKFLNPIMQNKLHIRCLNEYLKEEYPVYSVIAFSQRCELKKIELGHLSKENNYDKLAYETVKLEIDMSDNSFKSSDFDIEVAKRDVLSGICEI